MHNASMAIHDDDDGRWYPFLAAAVAAGGAVTLSIGAATDSGAAAIVGGNVTAVGFLAYDVVRHMTVDYEFFRRTDKHE
jgi:hypothetical protein